MENIINVSSSLFSFLDTYSLNTLNSKCMEPPAMSSGELERNNKIIVLNTLMVGNKH